MRKFTGLGVCLLLLIMSGCDSRSAVQKATGASAEQGREIERVLQSAGVDMETIEVAGEPDSVVFKAQALGMADGKYTGYTVVDREGAAYDMAVRNDDQVVAVILRLSDSKIIYQSDMIP